MGAPSMVGQRLCRGVRHRRVPTVVVVPIELEEQGAACGFSPFGEPHLRRIEQSAIPPAVAASKMRQRGPVKCFPDVSLNDFWKRMTRIILTSINEIPS